MLSNRGKSPFSRFQSPETLFNYHLTTYLTRYALFSNLNQPDLVTLMRNTLTSALKDQFTEDKELLDTFME